MQSAIVKSWASTIGARGGLSADPLCPLILVSQCGSGKEVRGVECGEDWCKMKAGRAQYQQPLSYPPELPSIRSCAGEIATTGMNRPVLVLEAFLWMSEGTSWTSPA